MDCLADGEYSIKIDAGFGSTIAAQVNIATDITAMGYSATASPATKYFLPNLTKTLGGTQGWTTPILLQSVTATTATTHKSALNASASDRSGFSI